jgi:hypothetical protein
MPSLAPEVFAMTDVAGRNQLRRSEPGGVCEAVLFDMSDWFFCMKHAVTRVDILISTCGDCFGTFLLLDHQR